MELVFLTITLEVDSHMVFNALKNPGMAPGHIVFIVEEILCFIPCFHRLQSAIKFSFIPQK